MLKKIFCTTVILAAILGSLYLVAVHMVVNSAAAQDIAIPTYSSRVQCYVMTETFVNKTQYRDNRAFEVDVKFVNAAEEIFIENYSFRENDGFIYYSVNGGADNFVDDDEFAKDIWLFGLEYLGIDYQVTYD